MNLLEMREVKMRGDFTCHFCAILQTGDPGWFSAVFSEFSAAAFSSGCFHRDIYHKRGALIGSVCRLRKPDEWTSGVKNSTLWRLVSDFSPAFGCGRKGVGTDQGTDQGSIAKPY